MKNLLLKQTNYFYLILALMITSPLLSQSAPNKDALSFIQSPNLPYDSSATADDITSMYFNPAGIGLHPLQLGYFHGESKNDQIYDNVVFMNLFNLAFSGQWRITGNGFNAQRYTIGSGFTSKKVFSLGTTYSWFNSNSPSLQNYSEWNIGMIFRPSRWLSLSLVSKGINVPTFEDARVAPGIEAGLAFRPLPFAQESFTIAADLDVSVTGEIRQYRLFSEFSPTPGLAIFGGTTDLKDIFFGIKLSQNNSQIFAQGIYPDGRGSYYSGGFLVGKERFLTRNDPLKHYLVIPLELPVEEVKTPPSLFTPENTTFIEILRAIRTAASDPQIRGIMLTGRRFHGGWAQAEELRLELLRFQEESKKKVVAMLESPSNKEYYIATAAEKIYLPPAGNLELNGLSAEVYYLKDLFKKVGVTADFIAIGDYKSAPNTYTENGPNKFEKEQMEKLLSDLQKELKRGILTRRRNITEKKLDAIMQEGGYLSARQAKEAGLIDEVLYMSDLQKSMWKKREVSFDWSVNIASYLKTKFYDDQWGTKPTIAILTLEGEITSARKRGGSPFSRGGSGISSDFTVKLIERLKFDRKIKGVIIRINSPGGSSLASDMIWNEIRELQRYKPVIITLGNYAASGGYYLAVGADEIIGNHTTITGSIGVFTGKFSLKELYEKLGVHKEIYKTHPFSAIDSETTLFSEKEREMIKKNMLEFYNLFLDRVHKSRTQLTREEVEKNANGMVYTGYTAREKGMIDRVGGLSLAIQLMVSKTGLKNDYFNIQLFPDYDGPRLGKRSKMVTLSPALIKALDVVYSLHEFEQKDQVMFLMPYTIDIK